MTGEDSSVIITHHDHLSLRCREYLHAVDPFSFPIFAELDRNPGRLELIGSGVALQKGGQYFLITAEHVLDTIFNSNRDIYIADGSTDVPGSVYKLPSNTQQGWRLHPDKDCDLAVLRIAGALAGLKFMPAEKIIRTHLSSKGHYFLAGYPLSKNKQWDVNPHGAPKRTGIASIIVRVDQELDFARDKKNPNDFLGFRYDRVYAEGHLHEHGTGLRGLSGGGLWFFPNEDITNPLLAGIFIEFHRGSKNGYATMANLLKELL